MDCPFILAYPDPKSICYHEKAQSVPDFHRVCACVAMGDSIICYITGKKNPTYVCIITDENSRDWFFPGSRHSRWTTLLSSLAKEVLKSSCRHRLCSHLLGHFMVRHIFNRTLPSNEVTPE